MRIGLIASQQYENIYKGQSTSEGVQLRMLVAQLRNLWGMRGIDVALGPDYDFDRNGKRNFNDNVKWEHAHGPFDLLLSFHSNAAGDSMVLWGTSAKSANYGKRIMNALNADNPFPGDTFTYYPRKVAEVANTKSPAVLIELSRHDWAAQAADLVRRISDGSLARHLDRVLTRALGLPQPTPTPQPTPVPEEDIMASINDLRTVIREELAAYGRERITVSAGTDREWTTTRDAALAAAAELEKITMGADIIRLDDAMAEVLEQARAAREVAP